MKHATTLFVVAILGVANGQEFGGHALFVRTSAAAAAHSRTQRAAPASPADVMAQNILEWIQGIYRQGARKIRQQSESNAYLPPFSTQRPPERPRPFRPPSSQQPGFSQGQNEVIGYNTFQRPSSLYPPPNAGFPSPSSGQSSSTIAPPFSTGRPGFSVSPSGGQISSSTYLPPQGFGTSTSYNPRPLPTTVPPFQTSGSQTFPPLGQSTVYLPPSRATSPPLPTPTSSGGLPSATAGFPSSVSGGFSTPGGFSTSGTFSTGGGSTSGGFSSSGFSTGYPSERPSPSFPTPGSTSGGSSIGAGTTSGGYPSAGYPSTGFPATGGYPSSAGYPSSDGGYTSSTPGVPFPPFTTPGENVGGTTGGTTGGTVGGTPGTGTAGVSTGGTGGITGGTTGGATGGTTGESTGGGAETTQGVGSTTTGGATDDDLNHPPHIHSIDVQCSKTMMTINIEFNRAFDGVIYSKGYFMNPDCRYVEQNSGQTTYSFTVSLDSCGTQFINDFEGEAGQAYLENVLVLQNEPGIQEVWDTVRRVRCLWEGNINKALSVSLSVDMLNQEIVTFSGDTAVAKLDIQMGRGPFAPVADGLVKIGESMTLVVSIEGDPAFDLQVRDCVARDESSTNMVALTDGRGCILKPKLFGAFQKTNATGSTGASIIAYAFFQAFKFPDVMDLFIECNVELCKTDCEPCPTPDQQIEPGRRRRSVEYTPAPLNLSSNLMSEPVRVGRGFKVIMLDDLSTVSNQVLQNMEETAIEEIARVKNVCMSNSGFYAAFSLMLSTLVITTISTAALYLKLQRVYRTKHLQS